MFFAMQFHSVIVSQSGNNDSFDFILANVTGLHGLEQSLEKLNICFTLGMYHIPRLYK